jgi:glycosyltransferase involved in cell wall biosynthesis
MSIRTSFIQQLPFAKQQYRYYLPLFPTAVEQFDMNEFDLVISSNHCVAKGVRTKPNTLHICYCHTPMRYIWDLYGEYFGQGRAGIAERMGMKLFLNTLRRWDVRTARNPHWYIANSQNIKLKIRKFYNCAADVIYPPVDTSRFQLSHRRGKYFLIISAFVPYKRIDLAVEGFKRTGEKLIIVGKGPDAKRLKKLAAPNIEFVGWQSDEELNELYAGCKAVVFPGEEDFGIVPVEAMACGRPVIAFAKGGATETVVDTPSLKTGITFQEQTVDSICEAIRSFKEEDFKPKDLRQYALGFDRQVFKRKMKEYVENKWKEFSR